MFGDEHNVRHLQKRGFVIIIIIVDCDFLKSRS